MNIGLVRDLSAISWSSAWTRSLALYQTLITLSYLSSSVIKPLEYCLLILSTVFLESAIILDLELLVATSCVETVAPLTVEYLNPKSLSLSSIIEVSVVL